ncbi:MAG: PqqD family protein [Acidobacteriota bacterium]|nr:PqqD family protein [Acidobacteriota bacterium]
MQNLQKPVARHEGLVVQEMPDEVLVYDLNTNKAHCLNKSAAAVWKNCDGTNSISDIAAILKNEFKTPVTEDFVWLAIDQLGKDELLEQKLTAPTNGLTRREAMRRVALASLVALPVVASLTAPTAAQAASVCQNTGASCTCSATNPGPNNASCAELGGTPSGCTGACACNNIAPNSNTGTCQQA